MDSGGAGALEERMSELRTGIRKAVLAGEPDRAKTLREELAQTGRDWEAALEAIAGQPAAWPDNGPGGSLLPVRAQVHEALSLLQVPAQPSLLDIVHQAFFGASFQAARVTSLRRDEERSYRSAPDARPYYICSALRAELLSPVRGLLAVSSWPLEQRMIGPLSPRVDLLTAAVNVARAAERVPGTPLPVMRLLSRFAVSVPGARQDPGGTVTARSLIAAAEAELGEHREKDRGARASAAEQARQRLDAAQRLFGPKEPGRLARARLGPAAAVTPAPGRRSSR